MKLLNPRVMGGFEKFMHGNDLLKLVIIPIFTVEDGLEVGLTRCQLVLGN